MSKKTTPSKNPAKVPVSALCLGFEGPQASTQFVGDGDDKKPQLDMIIYSGGTIKNHWWWDDLLIDLDGIVFSKKKYPILENHDRNLKIAFHNGSPIVDKNLRVDPAKVVFVSTPESQQFQTVSSEGFPYEASARVAPMVIEYVKSGATSEANGIKLKGPGTIFRKCGFVEGSVCVFGYDRNTRSTAFSDEEVELNCEFYGDTPRSYHLFQDPNKEVDGKMDRDTLLKEHPDLVKQIQDEAVAGAKDGLKSQFDEQFNQISGTIERLQATVESQDKTIKDLGNKNLKLEKENTIRTESEMATKAGGIWVAKLSKSDVPDHMHEKIQDHVKHSSFIDKETSECDWTKFGEAVDAEIKDWEIRLSKGASSVHGGGYNERTPDDGDGQSDTELEAEDKWVDDMVALAQDGNGGDE